MGFNILKFVYVYILKKLNPGLLPNLQKKKCKKNGGVGGGVNILKFVYVIILKKLNPGLHPTWGKKVKSWLASRLKKIPSLHPTHTSTHPATRYPFDPHSHFHHCPCSVHPYISTNTVINNALLMQQTTGLTVTGQNLHPGGAGHEILMEILKESKSSRGLEAVPLPVSG